MKIMVAISHLKQLVIQASDTIMSIECVNCYTKIKRSSDEEMLILNGGIDVFALKKNADTIRKRRFTLISTRFRGEE